MPKAGKKGRKKAGMKTKKCERPIRPSKNPDRIPLRWFLRSMITDAARRGRRAKAQEKQNSPAKVESQLPPKIEYDSLKRNRRLADAAMAPALFLPVIKVAAMNIVRGSANPPARVAILSAMVRGRTKPRSAAERKGRMK